MVNGGPQPRSGGEKKKKALIVWHLNTPQRALRSKKFNPDRKFQSWLEIFNPGRNFQSTSATECIPEGPSLEKIQDRPPGLNFQARLKRMTFSSEIENFKRATHQTPIFVGNSQGQDWKKFKRDWSFSSEIENFKRKTWSFQAFKRDWFFFKIRALWDLERSPRGSTQARGSKKEPDGGGGKEEGSNT